ncbi:4-hydroxy-tetrahydrodipicolinate synthase [Methanohalophilus levihalophilus]|uniref:4-hydroxy-tetrahydrodipicolinate synthase n=1 Tax=Methanohalophilus levihalophilus TaxID=1431282 RepID=UPI001AEA87C8|nr:4-hydroxy-tetrahydrodipicolinate synthase [Methanohalophilus levihalophilus]MBP2029287.1 4-hydroxy-tetrahydrodipicolinate synthase [Methanohalophilus levihalophilus]
MFQGVLPALTTPFTADGKIDREGLKRNIEFVENGGVSGVVTCGTTGESATLSIKEHEELIDLTIEYASVPVIAGTGSNNTAEAIELTKYAANAGADGALVISPYYNKPNPEGLIRHFKAIAASVDIPILLYNVPSRTGQDMSLEVITELAKVSNIVGIKEASGSIPKVTRILEETADEEFIVFSGEDDLIFPIVALGGVGVISVVADVAPAKTVELVKATQLGDFETAKKLHFELAPLIRQLFAETNPIPVKRAMEIMGLAAGPLRLPLAPLSPENEKNLVEALRNAGCLE